MALVLPEGIIPQLRIVLPECSIPNLRPQDFLFEARLFSPQLDPGKQCRAQPKKEAGHTAPQSACPGPLERTRHGPRGPNH